MNCLSLQVRSSAVLGALLLAASLPPDGLAGVAGGSGENGQPGSPARSARGRMGAAKTSAGRGRSLVMQVRGGS